MFVSVAVVAWSVARQLRNSARSLDKHHRLAVEQAAALAMERERARQQVDLRADLLSTVDELANGEAIADIRIRAQVAAPLVDAAREALTNVAKHGDTRRATLRAFRSDGASPWRSSTLVGATTRRRPVATSGCVVRYGNGCATSAAEPRSNRHRRPAHGRARHRVVVEEAPARLGGAAAATQRARLSTALHDRILQTLEILSRGCVLRDDQLHDRVADRAAWLRL